MQQLFQSLVGKQKVSEEQYLNVLQKFIDHNDPEVVSILIKQYPQNFQKYYNKLNRKQQGFISRNKLA